MYLLPRLLVIGRVKHYSHNGKLYSYSPYAREIDIWADLFSEVQIAGTFLHETPPGDCTPFTRSNIRILSIPEAGGHGFKAKLQQLFALPKILWKLIGHMRKADVIHPRCPSDLGFLGLVLGPIFSNRLIAKYATQWLPYRGEPWTWRLQRRVMSSFWWRGPVTVYGKWPNQPPNIIPFFTSILTDQQIVQARAAAIRPRDPGVFRILFVGRLSTSKNVDVLLRAVSLLKTSTRKIECRIIGEGPEQRALEELAALLGIERQITFTGGIGFDDVLEHYEQADSLVLASDVEGWPKAIAEAMAFGLVCIGTERGMMPQMLGEGRGLLVPPRNPEALARALQQIHDDPKEARAMATRAAAWAQKYSLEGLREALRDLMTEKWGLSCSETKEDGSRQTVKNTPPQSVVEDISTEEILK